MALDTNAVAAIIGLGAPVLCVDTCSILDLMRDPTRESVRPDDMTAAISLLRCLETGSELIGLIADQVRLEFNEHVAAVEAESDQAIKRLAFQLKRINGVVTALGGQCSALPQHFESHVSRARGIADRWIANSTSAPQSTDIPNKALSRLNQARTPARKGKDSMKDCVVIETYLETVGQLRDAGLNSKIVFMSSNTKDYTGEPGTHLRPDLGAEFTALRIEYASNISHARHLLGLS